MKKISSSRLTRLDVYRELDKRGGLNREAQVEMERLEAGRLGEDMVCEMIEEFGESHWTIMRNVWLNYYGEFECDLILLTSIGIVTFEIKYFSGVYEFKDGQCIRNGTKIGRNAVNQAYRIFTNFRNLLASNGFKMEVINVLVFAGEHYDVKVHDQVKDFEILTINQLRDFIWKIAKEENRGAHHQVDHRQLIQFLKANKIENPFPPKPLTDEMSKKLQAGVMCSRCERFGVDMSKPYVACGCGMYEPRENAILRTICEYGIIHFDKDFTASEVLEFFGGDISRSTVVKYLNKYFDKIGVGKSTRYRNSAKSFGEYMKKFNLTKPRYLKF